MFFDLDATEGDWFNFFESRVNEKGEVVYDDPRPDAGRVCLRSPVPHMEAVQAQKKRKFEFVLNPLTRSMERVGYLEDLTPEAAKKERDDRWDYTIVDFKGFEDKDGNEIPCTRENKIRFMGNAVFDRFVARCLNIIFSAGIKAAGPVEKN